MAAKIAACIHVTTFLALFIFTPSTSLACPNGCVCSGGSRVMCPNADCVCGDSTRAVCLGDRCVCRDGSRPTCSRNPCVCSEGGQLLCSGGVCVCSYGRRVVCRNAGYNAIPDKIPSDTYHLDLTRNNLRVIAPGEFEKIGATEIRELVLDHNQISQIEPNAFRGLQDLEILSLKNNKISTLESYTLGRISGNSETCARKSCFIDLSYNNLTRVGEYAFAWTKRMRIIFDGGHAEELSIEPYAFYGIQNIPVIRIANYKGLKIKRGTFTNVENIGNLEIQDTRIPALVKYTFEGIRGLRHLKIDNCDIVSMSPYAFSGINYATSNERDAIVLNESKVLVFTNFSGIFTLTNSKVTSIPGNAFRDTNLADIVMTSNVIDKVAPYAFRGLPHLNSLVLQYNSLAKLSENSMSLLRNVETIRFYANNITAIEGHAFQDSANIGRLELSFQPRHNLTIHEKAFGGLEDIDYVVIRDFSNLDLKPDAFLGLLDVNILDISYVNLPVVQKHTFRGLMKVKRLHLTYCNIASIEGNAFEGAIESIDLSQGNNLPCDCKTAKTLKAFANTFSKYNVKCNPKRNNATRFALQNAMVASDVGVLCEPHYNVTSSQAPTMDFFFPLLSVTLFILFHESQVV